MPITLRSGHNLFYSASPLDVSALAGAAGDLLTNGANLSQYFDELGGWHPRLVFQPGAMLYRARAELALDVALPATAPALSGAPPRGLGFYTSSSPGSWCRCVRHSVLAVGHAGAALSLDERAVLGSSVHFGTFAAGPPLAPSPPAPPPLEIDAWDVAARRLRAEARGRRLYLAMGGGEINFYQTTEDHFFPPEQVLNLPIFDPRYTVRAVTDRLMRDLFHGTIDGNYGKPRYMYARTSGLLGWGRFDEWTCELSTRFIGIMPLDTYAQHSYKWHGFGLDYNGHSVPCWETLLKMEGSLVPEFKRAFDAVHAALGERLDVVELFNELSESDAFLWDGAGVAYMPGVWGDPAVVGTPEYPNDVGRRVNGGAPRRFWDMFAGAVDATAAQKHAALRELAAHVRRVRPGAILPMTDYSIAFGGDKLDVVLAQAAAVGPDAVDAISFQMHTGCAEMANSWAELRAQFVARQPLTSGFTKARIANARALLAENFRRSEQVFVEHPAAAHWGSSKVLQTHIAELDFSMCLEDTPSNPLYGDVEFDYRQEGTNAWDRFYVYAHVVYNTCFSRARCTHLMHWSVHDLSRWRQAEADHFTLFDLMGRPHASFYALMDALDERTHALCGDATPHDGTHNASAVQALRAAGRHALANYCELGTLPVVDSERVGAPPPPAPPPPAPPPPPAAPHARPCVAQNASVRVRAEGAGAQTRVTSQLTGVLTAPGGPSVASSAALDGSADWYFPWYVGPVAVEGAADAAAGASSAAAVRLRVVAGPAEEPPFRVGAVRWVYPERRRPPDGAAVAALQADALCFDLDVHPAKGDECASFAACAVPHTSPHAMYHVAFALHDTLPPAAGAAPRALNASAGGEVLFATVHGVGVEWAAGGVAALPGSTGASWAASRGATAAYARDGARVRTGAATAAGAAGAAIQWAEARVPPDGNAGALGAPPTPGAAPPADADPASVVFRFDVPPGGALAFDLMFGARAFGTGEVLRDDLHGASVRLRKCVTLRRFAADGGAVPDCAPPAEPPPAPPPPPPAACYEGEGPEATPRVSVRDARLFTSSRAQPGRLVAAGRAVASADHEQTGWFHPWFLNATWLPSAPDAAAQLAATTPIGVQLELQPTGKGQFDIGQIPFFDANRVESATAAHTFELVGDAICYTLDVRALNGDACRSFAECANPYNRVRHGVHVVGRLTDAIDAAAPTAPGALAVPPFYILAHDVDAAWTPTEGPRPADGAAGSHMGEWVASSLASAVYARNRSRVAVGGSGANMDAAPFWAEHVFELPPGEAAVHDEDLEWPYDADPNGVAFRFDTGGAFDLLFGFRVRGHGGIDPVAARRQCFTIRRDADDAALTARAQFADGCAP